MPSLELTGGRQEELLKKIESDWVSLNESQRNTLVKNLISIDNPEQGNSFLQKSFDCCYGEVISSEIYQEYVFLVLREYISEYKWIKYPISIAKQLRLSRESVDKLERQILDVIRNSDSKKFRERVEYAISNDISIVNLLNPNDQIIINACLELCPDKQEQQLYEVFCEFDCKHQTNYAERTSFYAKRIKETLSQFVKQLEQEMCTFDVEGNNRGQAWEYAYKFGCENEPSFHERVITETRTYTYIDILGWRDLYNALNGKKIVIGHNIRAWDCKILEKIQNGGHAGCGRAELH